MPVSATSVQTLRHGIGADPRHYQIATLAALLTYGLVVLGFEQPLSHVIAIVVMAIGTEAALARFVCRRKFDVLSPLITALSLSILLRTSGITACTIAAAIAIGSKYCMRVGGKHVFNPANFAISLLILTTDSAWISPGQWGRDAVIVFGMAALATLVLSCAKRLDMAFAFLSAYAILLFARAVHLGDPMAIPLQQMQSGALLLFAFFMITDPKTTPDRRSTRIVYACAVASLAMLLQYVAHWPEGLMLALFFASPLVPLLDRFAPALRAERFQWRRPTL